MLEFRLIYEQIEAAKAQMHSGSLLGSRLALILLDNAAELLMHEELRIRFMYDDQWVPKWELARSEWISEGRGPKYTAEERRNAEREFEPKLRILSYRLDRISADDRIVLSVSHRMRCEAFHQGRLRPGIFQIVVNLLYRTVVDLTASLSGPQLVVYGGQPSVEDKAFMERFEVSDPYSLVTEEGKRRLADRLLSGILPSQTATAEILSADLVERIEWIMDSLSDLSEKRADSEIDRHLQYVQFWRDVGANLAKNDVREPRLEQSFEEWQTQGRAKYTLLRWTPPSRQLSAVLKLQPCS